MFGWRPEESSMQCFMYPNASYFLPLFYIISRSKPCPQRGSTRLNSAHTRRRRPKVQRYDFIQSGSNEGELSFPQFCDPAMAHTGCGADPTHEGFGRK